MSAAEKIENPLLDKVTINAFIDGVTKTLSTMAQTTVSFSKPMIEKSLVPRGEVIGVLGMVAPPLRATLTLSFTKNAILKIVENMLGETYAEIDQNSIDAAGELTNMIYGSAKTTLNAAGFKFEMALPTVIHGDFKAVANQKGTTLVIPFQLSTKEEFFIGITIS